MKILVTGGTGFVGSHTVVALLKAGHDVRLLIRNPKKMQQVFANHGCAIEDYVLGDVTDKAAIHKALVGCDGVVHAAAMVATSKKMAALVRRTNVEGTRNVIGQAVEMGIGHIIHVSSITALFDPRAKIVNENSSPGTAKDAYGSSKAETEYYVRSLQDAGAPIVVTYPTGVIGPYDPGTTEPLQGLVMMLKTLATETTSGIQYVDVRDVADVHVQILQREKLTPDRYMLGGYYYEWGQLYDTLEELTGRKLLRIYVPPKILSSIGYLADQFIRFSGIQTPISITQEATAYATDWCHADSTKLIKELDFKFRDGKQSMADTVVWLANAGFLKPKHIGLLAGNHQIGTKLAVNNA